MEMKMLSLTRAKTLIMINRKTMINSASREGITNCFKTFAFSCLMKLSKCWPKMSKKGLKRIHSYPNRLRLDNSMLRQIILLHQILL
jgi:hypothetical protein